MHNQFKVKISEDSVNIADSDVITSLPNYYLIILLKIIFMKFLKKLIMLIFISKSVDIT